MMPAYKALTTKPQDKYYIIGYNCYLNNLPKDLADDLSWTDRPAFIAGWEAAQRKADKSPKLMKLALKA